jgi:hypothetical protein
MAKAKVGMIGTAKAVVVDTGAVVADTARAGFEGAKGLAITAGSCRG